VSSTEPADAPATAPAPVTEPERAPPPREPEGAPPRAPVGALPPGPPAASPPPAGEDDTAEQRALRPPLRQRLRAALDPRAIGRRLRALPRLIVLYIARQVPAVAAGAAASIPVIVSTVHAARAGWEPNGDDGIIVTRALDVFTNHTPLIGQYSEAGEVTGHIVHSPGPMLYWLLAIPVRLGGPASAAIAMGVVNCLCIVICVVLARRRGGILLMIATALGIALMCQSLSAEVFHDVWNPSAAMFPFLALIFLSWSVAAGDYRLLPAVAIFASFVVQTHLTYLAPTLVLGAVALAGLTATRLLKRRAAGKAGEPRPKRVVWRWLVLTIVVFGLCWSAPVIDELEHSPGNLSLVVATFNDRGTTLGSSVGWSAVARAIGWKPWWLFVPVSEWGRKYSVRRPPSSSQADFAIAVLAALALIAIAAALRRRLDMSAAALMTLGMCLGLGANAASTPVKPLLAGTLGYTLWWGSQLGFFAYLVIIWSAWLALAWLARFAWPRLLGLIGRETMQVPRLALLAAAGAIVLAGVAGTADVGRAVANEERPDSHAHLYAPTTTLGRALTAALPPQVSIDYLQGPLDVATQPIEPPMRFWLVKHGDRPLANGSLARLGTYYILDHRRYSWVVYIAGGHHDHPPPRSLGLHLVGHVHFLDSWGWENMGAWVGRPVHHHKHHRHRHRRRAAAAKPA